MRRCLGAVLGVVILAGCQCRQTASHFQSTPLGCVDDTDCPSTTFYFCSTNLGLCVPSCSTSADCTASVRGEFAFEPCDKGLGCRCDHRVCVAAQCSVDDECVSPLVCRSGACSAPPEPSGVARCEVVIESAVVALGTTFEATVLAVDARGAAVVPTGARWSIAGGTIREERGLTVVVSTSRVGAVEVAATLGSATCTGAVKVVSAGDIPPGAIDVLALDADTGQPIAGVTAVATSTALPSAPMASTGPQGIARLTVGAAPSATVTAYHPDYDFCTVTEFALPGAGAPGAAVLLPLRPNRGELVGGIAGEFNAPAPPFLEANIGLVGLSVPQVAPDLSTETLVGPNVSLRGVELWAVGRTKPVEAVPLGGSITSPTVSGEAVKPVYGALGAAGRCADAGTDLGGGLRCGTRTAWAMTYRAHWGSLNFSLLLATPDNRDLFAELLLTQLRWGRPFHSTLARDVTFALRPPPALPDGGADLTNTSRLRRLDLDAEQVPMAFSSVVEIPRVPVFQQRFAPSVLLLVGAQVPGRGWVPLGLGAGLPHPDGWVARETAWQGARQIRFRAAPPHHGIEGSPLQIIAVARSRRSGSEQTGAATSATVLPLPGNRLVYDEDGGASLALPEFPPFPEGAEYVAGPTDAGTTTLRSLRFASDGGVSGSVVKVVFTNAQGHRWVVLVDPALASTGVALPVPPPGFADRVLWNGAAPPRSKLEVQTLRLEDRGRPLSFEEAVRWNATNLDRVSELTTGFASMAYPSP